MSDDELITIFDGFPTIEIRKSNDFVTEVWINDRLVCEYTYPNEDESINNIKWEEDHHPSQLHGYRIKGRIGGEL